MARFIFTLPFLFLLTTCATISSSVQGPFKLSDPLARLDSADEFAPLEYGADAYIFIDAPNARPILDLFTIGNMTHEQFGQIAEQTSAIRVALYKKTADGQKNNFMAAARGHYPNVLSAMALTASPDWQKVRAWNGAPYWYSEAAGVSLAMNTNWALFSSNEPFAREPAPLPPAGFDVFRQGAVVSGWLIDDSTLNKMFEVMEIPIKIDAKTMFFRVDGLQSPADSNGETYKIILQFDLSAPEQSGGLLTLFELAGLFIAENSASDAPLSLAAKSLLTNSVQAEEGVLTLTTAGLSAERLGLIFSVFSACL
ncbi:MAG: hypothetical protein LBH75_07195 [Treponema sp.]|jgi:hypothetical protein|nr:hypothetical protein [Treponema sp.]